MLKQKKEGKGEKEKEIRVKSKHYCQSFPYTGMLNMINLNASEFPLRI